MVWAALLAQSCVCVCVRNLILGAGGEGTAVLGKQLLTPFRTV